MPLAIVDEKLKRLEISLSTVVPRLFALVTAENGSKHNFNIVQHNQFNINSTTLP